MKAIIAIIAIAATASADIYLDTEFNIPIDGQEETEARFIAEVTETAGEWAYTVGVGYRPPFTDGSFDPSVTVNIGVARGITECAAIHFRTEDIPLVENHVLNPRLTVGASFRLQ